MSDKYKKLRAVGRGSFGIVFLCRSVADASEVIIKEIPVDSMTKKEQEDSMIEAKVLSMLDHPSIVRHYGSILEDNALKLVMEYVPGGTLFQFLQARMGELLPEKAVLYWFAQMVVALNHVHSKHILHRDLKTANLLLSLDATVIKLGDFGISKILVSKSKALTVVGTPSYISPELCEGKPYGEKSDVWALGCILYEMITLRKAFEAPSLPALVMKITRGQVQPVPDRYSMQLRKFLQSLLHLDPDKRPTTQAMLSHPLLLPHVVAFRLRCGLPTLYCGVDDEQRMALLGI